DHPAERGTMQTVARRMIRPQRRPAAMRDRDDRAGPRRDELDVDMRDLFRREVRVPPRKREPLRRLPHEHAPDFEHMRAAAVVAIDGFEQAPADMRLETDEAALPAGVPELRPAPPPAIDLVGENFERGGRWYGHRNAHARLIAAAHDEVFRERRVR